MTPHWAARSPHQHRQDVEQVIESCQDVFDAEDGVGLDDFQLTRARSDEKSRADRQDELQARFKQRYAQVKQLKRAGQIGETTAGMVEAVKGGLEEAAQKLVSEENADRSELYDLIAKKEGTTAAAVAERNALRNFQRAETGEYLKGKDGQLVATYFFRDIKLNPTVKPGQFEPAALKP